VIDADIATISGAADKVRLLKGPSPSVMHFEFQSGPDASLPRRMNVYNSVLEHRHDLPVASVVILLSPQADLSCISGVYERSVPQQSEPYRRFRYQVVRVWQLPVASLLQGGLGCLALAPISAVTEPALPEIVHEIKRRFAEIEDKDRVGRLWTAVYVLMGMRYDKILVDELLQGVMNMEESVTYQAIVQKGRAEGRVEGAAEEARKLILRLGKERFQAAPSASVRSRLQGIVGLTELESMAERLMHCRSWADLFSEPRKPRRRRS